MQRLVEEHGVSLRWTAFPLHPETPPEGRSLEELFAGRGLDIPAMLARLRATAEAEGLPFGERAMTYNSRRAQELGKWAEDRGAGEAFHEAAFRAYFADGANIHGDQALADIARAAGLAPEAGLAALEQGLYAPAVDADWLRSRRMGVTAVPTFVCEGRGLVGFQPYRALAELVGGRGLPSLIP